MKKSKELIEQMVKAMPREVYPCASDCEYTYPAEELYYDVIADEYYCELCFDSIRYERGFRGMSHIYDLPTLADVKHALLVGEDVSVV